MPFLAHFLRLSQTMSKTTSCILIECLKIVALMFMPLAAAEGFFTGRSYAVEPPPIRSGRSLR